jgi:hypothetical protein
VLLLLLLSGPEGDMKHWLCKLGICCVLAASLFPKEEILGLPRVRHGLLVAWLSILET